MITLYQAEWCPYCHRVRQVLTELGLTHVAVCVVAKPDDRGDLRAVSGQKGIPVLVDGERTIAGSDEIIEYLRGAYPPAADADKHEQAGFFRYVLETDMGPADALTHLKNALADQRIDVLSETAITPKEGDATATYVLLQGTVPFAVAMDLSVDPSVPSALVIPMAVYPIESGSQITITDPYVGVWLFGETALLKTAGKLRERVKKLFEAL